MKSMQTQAGALRILLFAAAMLALGTLLHPLSARAGETIFYTAIRPANWDIYLFEEPEKPPRRLTTQPSITMRLFLRTAVMWFSVPSDRETLTSLFLTS